jgi:putative phosphoribosyl transferase
MLFQDRKDAGRLLATLLLPFAHRRNLLVLALPRGGVPVAAEVANQLNEPLDVFVVRKLGVPGQVELALGAIASGGVRVLNEEVVKALNISSEEIERVTAAELPELQRRENLYRGGRAPVQVDGRTVLLVDDGVATGSTMRAAVAALRQLRPAQIIVAAPVGSATACEDLRAEADEVVCAATPPDFQAVGQFYREFGQTSDDEVRALLG